MRKWKIALLIFILVPLALFFWPQLYYYFYLPSKDDLDSAGNTKTAFSHWPIENELIISKPESFPPKEFKCAICYPRSADSAECKWRMGTWISRSILYIQPPERMLAHHIKNYFLAKAILSKYDDTDLDRLYFAFISPAIGTKSIDQACLVKFKKRCPELTYDEIIDLEVVSRFGPSKKPHDEIRKNINLFCTKN